MKGLLASVAIGAVGYFVFIPLVEDRVRLILGDFGSMRAALTPPSQTLQTVTVRELVIDGQALLDKRAYVQVTGVYLGLGESGYLYPPTHKPLDFGDSGFTVISENSPREVREFFYECKRVDQCSVTLTGHITECALKIARSATMPCIEAEKVIASR